MIASDTIRPNMADHNVPPSDEQPPWDEIAQGLAEMRDALMALSVLVKDHRATLDWHTAGEGRRLTQDTIDRASSGSHSPNACPD